jgi:CheY-like chemotaxis protein
MSKILVVDDSETIHLLLKNILTEEGFDVIGVWSAEEALKTLTTMKPDLILLDVKLPDIDGFELVKLLRRQATHRLVPIIMITGTAIDAKQKALGLRNGADDYLAKPFEPEELLERMRAVLRRSEARPIDPPASEPQKFVLPADLIADLPDPDAPLTVGQGLAAALCSPSRLTGDLPPVSIFYLLLLLALSACHAVIVSDLPIKPVIFGLLALTLWGLLVSILVVACSLMGVSCSWKQGTRLISLAGLPILLKLAGGLALSAETSLSPFLFSASPGLVLPNAPWWMYRLDLYEIWSVCLLARLVRHQSRATAAKTMMITGLLWASCVFMISVIQRMNG